MITMDGKFKYRNGEKPRIICVDAVGPFPVVTVKPSGGVVTHTSNGTVYESEEDPSEWDLIPIPSPPEYVPYDDSDRDEVRGKWIKSKYSQSQYCIVAFNQGHAQNLSWQAAFENWTYLDGSVFGKVKK